jgi:hypothetical protein
MHRTHASRSRALELNELLDNLLYDMRGEFGARTKVNKDRKVELPEFFLNTRVYDVVLADFLAAATSKLQRLHLEIHRIQVRVAKNQAAQLDFCFAGYDGHH